MILRIISLIALFTTTLTAQGDSFFPWTMPWDDSSINSTNLSGLNSSPAGASGFIHAEKGHLYANKDRIRFMGVNIVFGSAMPTHDEADKIAARLSRFGINCVRFHHMDSRPAPDGLLNKDMKTINTEMLERLDYFIAALKKHGIYSNINLHVGRKYPGFDDWGESTPKYWKGVDNFFQPMIAMQKEYARDLLTHKNPYTGNQYIDEPSVAIIEINNENGLLSEWRRGNLNEMTDPYKTELSRLWNAWLKKKYGSTQKLLSKWKVKKEPIGEEMLTDKIDAKSKEKGWNLQIIGDAKASLSSSTDGIECTIVQAGKENWHTQLHQNGLSFTADKPYTLTVALRADKKIKCSFTAMQAHEPWKRFWSEDITVGTEWKTVTLTFASTQTDAVSRLTITGLGLTTGKLYIKNASLKPGGVQGLLENESIEKASVNIFGSGNFLGRTPEGQRDWIRFLWDTESKYWNDMYAYLRTTLKAKQLILGTQVSYSPATMQGQLDIVDGHAYWQHPHFPGKPWDIDNWNIGNTPMAGIENGGTIPDLALRRVPGKPFIVTEYNHSAPNDYQAEALPLIAAYGALQDWDGIFIYSYGAHDKKWDNGYINNFFDSHSNPVKMKSLVSSVLLFRRGDITAANPKIIKAPDNSIFIEQLREAYRMPSSEYIGASRTESFMHYASIATQKSIAPELPYYSETKELVWGENSGRTVLINTQRSKGVIGAQKKYSFDAKSVIFDFNNSSTAWSAVLISAISGNNFSSGTFLITALGREENSGQKWLDEKRTSIGRNWGKGPVLVEGVDARVIFPVQSSRVKVWALDERGNRRSEIKVGGTSTSTIQLSEKHKTLWYEVEIK
jgi:Carbohydrate binding domain/Cellulase (glycosyl hydrolase family 5)